MTTVSSLQSCYLFALMTQTDEDFVGTHIHLFIYCVDKHGRQKSNLINLVNLINKVINNKVICNLINKVIC